LETFNGVAFEFVTDVEVLDYSLITAYADLWLVIYLIRFKPEAFYFLDNLNSYGMDINQYLQYDIS
jgi:hypothetical protein